MKRNTVALNAKGNQIVISPNDLMNVQTFKTKAHCSQDKRGRAEGKAALYIL